MEMWFDGSQGTDGPEGLGPVPPETAYRLLGAKWIPAIIRALGRGGLRYRDLDRRLPGVSQKVLTQNLNRLERSGLVRRQPRRGALHPGRFSPPGPSPPGPGGGGGPLGGGPGGVGGPAQEGGR